MMRPRNEPEETEALSIAFNEAIGKRFPNGEVSALEVVVAAMAVLSGYVSQVPDQQWKAEMLEELVSKLRKDWGLLQ